MGHHINYLSVFSAAIAAWIFGAIFYTTLGKIWMRAQGKTEESCKAEFAAKSGIAKFAPFVLSFVGALAAIARDRTNDPKKDSGLLDSMGGVFPIVIDAAFGSLDNNYRRDVAKALPKLAPQIIVLVSKAQGEGPVADEIAPHVGATYVMAVHSKRVDVPSEKIDLGGKDYDYVVPASDSNRTELLKVRGS